MIQLLLIWGETSLKALTEGMQVDANSVNRP